MRKFLRQSRCAFARECGGNCRWTVVEVQHGCQRWTIDVVKHIAGLIQILLLVSVDSPQHAKVDQQTHNVNHVAALVLGFQIEMNTRSLEAGIGRDKFHGAFCQSAQDNLTLRLFQRSKRETNQNVAALRERCTPIRVRSWTRAIGEIGWSFSQARDFSVDVKIPVRVPAEPFFQPLRMTAYKQVGFGIGALGAEERLLQNGAHCTLPLRIKRC